MDHHRHVDVVEMALGDELGLAEQELDLALACALQALLDIDELLGRHGEKDQLAGEMLGRACIAESPIATPSMPATWALWPQLWAAPVCGSASGWSEVRRLSSSPIKARRGPGALPREAALDAGQRQAGLRLEPERAHRVGDQRGGLRFVEAGLGVMQDRLAELDDLVAVAVDRLAHRLLQLFLADHPCLSSMARRTRRCPNVPLASLR